MTNRTLTTIPFHGATLAAVQGDSPQTTLVAMKPVVEGIGLDWEPQRKKIMRHPVIKSRTSIMEVRLDGDDRVREHTFLTLDMLNFWLATIHPDRIKDAGTRAKVIEYQTECARVLFNHFFGSALHANDASSLSDIDAGDLNARINASKHAMRLWGRAAGAWAWKSSGLPVPPRNLLTHSQQAVLNLLDNAA
ncbi:hypothetical protein J2D73_16790 [Acetobacter sacchari]|uniref:Antirepressor protein ant N-terminal domain-containing protein n=1 Tax=Acetobacter sacchari TaxID=2661687 RepID=A0ABS3LZX6_9PROT|nr:phage antirepressor N-terminal domain-containing protein [Acetobacter sacchari]MBO1361444.1 hypothetical protein [Acetobacter sacchari]